MITFERFIEKFDEKGEKTGWRYILITEGEAEKLKPGCKTSFRVKGKLDNLVIEQKALMPMGDGSFILPLNGELRIKLGKGEGDRVEAQLEEDTSEFVLDPHLLECLEAEPEAKIFFHSLPSSHQKYYSNWIGTAKTEPTKVKRLTQALNGLANKQRYDEMMRANKGKK